MTTEQMIEEIVNDGGSVYNATIPDKKQLLMRVYDIYEAGKKIDEEAFYRIRSDILENVYEIQRTTILTLRCKWLEEERERILAILKNVMDAKPCDEYTKTCDNCKLFKLINETP